MYLETSFEENEEKNTLAQRIKEKANVWFFFLSSLQNFSLNT